MAKVVDPSQSPVRSSVVHEYAPTSTNLRAPSSPQMGALRVDGLDDPDIGPGRCIPSSPKANKKKKIDPKEIVPLRVKLAMGVGETTQAVYVFIAGFYLNIFFLETACMDPFYVGLLQLCGGVWDTINDPMVGLLSDRTRTRFGRRRPWLLGASLPAGLSYFAIWQVLPDGTAEEVKFIYYLLCYICLSASITAVQVQITSLTPELTSDYDERTTLATYRLALGNILALTCLMAHSFIVQSFSHVDRHKGYAISAAIFGPCITLTALIAFWNIKERWRKDEEGGEKLSLCQSLKIVFTNKAFLIVEGVYLFGLSGIVLIQSNLILYAKYVLDDEEIITYLILTVQGVALLFVPAWLWFSKKYGKKAMYYVGGILMACAVSMLFALQGKEHLGLAFLISVVVGGCLTVVYLVPYAMLPDVIEVDEKKTGKRREGTYSGFFVVFMKISVTLSLAGSNWVLAAAGYESPKSSCGQEAEELADVQPDAVVNWIKALVGPMPAALFILATFFVWLFPITRETQAKLALEMEVLRNERSKIRKMGQIPTKCADITPPGSPTKMPMIGTDPEGSPSSFKGSPPTSKLPGVELFDIELDQ